MKSRPADSAFTALGVEAAAERYLDLLKRCLTRELFLDEEVVDALRWPTGNVLPEPAQMWPELRRIGMRLVRPFRDPTSRANGEDWPPHAETMVGRARLDNVHKLVRRVIRDGVPGDLVETGVWRGGTIILMRAILAAYNDAERCVWGCDSFEGLPPPRIDEYPDDAWFLTSDSQRDQLASAALCVPLEQVKANFARYGLLDERVKFLEGWFADTLPAAPIDRIAVLRLDGDLYESTMDALVNLEEKVTPGGYIIVDDYNSLDACRNAVEKYRADHGITDEIHRIDWTGVWWQKSARA